MLQKVLKLFGYSRHHPQVRLIRAGYDAAKTNDDNVNHWKASDALSAAQSNSGAVRYTLRNRARYEIANNTYAKGIILTLANDCVGTGPRLQLQGANKTDNRKIEFLFSAWAEENRLAEKLHLMRQTKAGDGESFLVFQRKEKSFGILIVEAERVVFPTVAAEGKGVAFSGDDSGIRFDQYGEPKSYFILKKNPSEAFSIADGDEVPAEQVIHWFRADRPGQIRGIPEITPALPLFAQLRRFTLAVIAAAETAADHAGVIESDAPPDGADPLEPMEVLEIERRMLTTMPAGWKMTQMKAEQPVTTYAEFKKEILNEIARCLNMPFNIAACNSGGYNYSSGRLDHQTYYKSIRVEQAHLERTVLNRIFKRWRLETQEALGLVIPEYPQWFWDGWEHIDPSKEASAQETRLKNNTTTLKAEYAKRGLDWEEELTQRAAEKDLEKELGIEVAEQPKQTVPPVNEDQDAPAEQEE
jgi:capsid protein